MKTKHISESRCLEDILSGKAVPCGSKCYQTADGSQFLGRASEEAVSEAHRLLDDKSTPQHVRDKLWDFLQYIQPLT